MEGQEQCYANMVWYGDEPEEEDGLGSVKEETEDSDDDIVNNEDIGISHLIDVLAKEPVPSSPNEQIDLDQTSTALDGDVYWPDTTIDEAIDDPYQ